MINSQVELTIAKGEYIDDILTLTEFGLPVGVANVRYAGQIDNIQFIINNNKKTGVLEVVEDIDNVGKFYLRERTFPAAWATTYPNVNNFVNGLTNVATRSNVENILKDWDVSVLGRLEAELAASIENSTTFAAEFIALCNLKPDATNAFRVIENSTLSTNIYALDVLSESIKNGYKSVAQLTQEFKNCGNKLWTTIDDSEGLFLGRMATYYDVNLIYKPTREQVGVALISDDILEFHLKIPDALQKQGIGSSVFSSAIEDYLPSKIKGWWKTSDIYTSGESVNLTIFRKLVNEGMDPIVAVFEIPTGKILKSNGFGGVPEIIKNTPDEVIVYFNPIN